MKIAKKNIGDVAVITIAIVLILAGLFLLCSVVYGQEITSMTRHKNGTIIVHYDNGVNLMDKDGQLIVNDNGRYFTGFYTKSGFCLKQIGTGDESYECQLTR